MLQIKVKECVGSFLILCFKPNIEALNLRFGFLLSGYYVCILL